MEEYLILEFSDMFGNHKFYRFQNGYGASVIKFINNIYELAVIKFYNSTDNFEVCYDTPITNDILKFNNLLYVKETLQLINDLEERNSIN